MSATLCRPDRHYFPPFQGTSDLGGGAQKCECGACLIDRTLGGGRVVELAVVLAAPEDTR